jgi:hyperosmotically inducible protein
MGSLIRTLIVVVIVFLVGAYFLGYLPNTTAVLSAPPKLEVGKLPSSDQVKERAAQAASRMDDTLADTALTTKIKAKITLDDSLNGTSISVHTQDSVVTIAGTVATAAQQERALQLTRETNGVKSVTNELKVAR